MLTLLFYERDDAAPTARDDLDLALQAHGVELDGGAGDAYRAGRWRDAATAAWCHVDAGAAPLEDDEMHAPTRYAGWREVPLTVQVPLSGAHWRAVECFAFVERLLGALPGVHALDSEDTRRSDDDEAGPFAWDRLRLLASWERQHHAQYSERVPPLPRMERRASVALWRYRRERPAGRERHPELVWPEALALLDDGQHARSAAVWTDAAAAWALPPVELIVVRRDDDAGALPADEIATAGAPAPLAIAQAQRLEPGPRLDDLFRRARLLPTRRFRALADDDWSD